MKSLYLLPLLASSMLTSLPATASAQNGFESYWEEYGSDPLPVVEVVGGRRLERIFLDYRDGMLTAQFSAGGAEVELPVSDTMAESYQLPDLSFEGPARSAIAAEDYDSALRVLRPAVYPMIRFHSIQESFFQLHRSIRTLLGTLILAGELAEAEAILSRMELDEMGVPYSQIAMQLVNAYLEAGDGRSAARLVATVPLEGKYRRNITGLVQLADGLRNAGEYQAVIPLYQQIEASGPPEFAADAKMFLAYSYVLDGQLGNAREIIDGIEEPPADSRLFSLYKLLEGSLLYQEGSYSEALDLFTRGFVRASTSYSWVPEMLYYIGDCYVRSEEPTAARNVWNEVVLLYPDSSWAGRAREGMSALPPATPDQG